MFLEIVSPDAQLFEGKVDSITAPGETGFFQVLNNHAPIVSTLVKGKIKIDSSESLNKDFGLIFEKVGNYDEEMKVGYEDWEFNIRLGNNGFYIPIGNHVSTSQQKMIVENITKLLV